MSKKFVKNGAPKRGEASLTVSSPAPLKGKELRDSRKFYFLG
jgi:hypothetical protein